MENPLCRSISHCYVRFPAIWCTCQVNMEDIAKRTAEAQTWALTTSFPWRSPWCDIAWRWHVWPCRYDCTDLLCCLLHISWHPVQPKKLVQTLVAILVRKLRPSARCEPYLWGLWGLIRKVGGGLARSACNEIWWFLLEFRCTFAKFRNLIVLSSRAGCFAPNAWIWQFISSKLGCFARYTWWDILVKSEV